MNNGIISSGTTNTAKRCFDAYEHALRSYIGLSTERQLSRQEDYALAEALTFGRRGWVKVGSETRKRMNSVNKQHVYRRSKSVALPDFTTYFLYACSLEYQGNTKDAMAYFRRAQSVFGSSQHLYNILGNLFVPACRHEQYQIRTNNEPAQSVSDYSGNCL